MIPPATRYAFAVRGYLSPRLQAAFPGLHCIAHSDGTTSIVGALPDQAAVFGVLRTIERLGLTVLAFSHQVEEPHGK